MKSIAFFNNKGGVGKTTLLCNVAAFLALHAKKRVLVIDADPQCNATQLMLDEDAVLDIYDNAKSFTIHSVVHPLAQGKGYQDSLQFRHIPDYGVDLIPGDPKLALKEDLLSKDWQDAVAGEIRGVRTTFLFKDLLARCTSYDFVLFDMGPSLGSINRAVLLACDFFLSPMSIDIFSLKAIENISTSLLEWKRKLDHGLSQLDDENRQDLPSDTAFSIRFVGYVAQQYIQKTTGGEKRAVSAYEGIMKRIPNSVATFFVRKLQPNEPSLQYEIGTIPNLYSLIPMAQSAHKPIFALKAADGVRGAHFNKVRDAEDIYRVVTGQLLVNIQELAK